MNAWTPQELINTIQVQVTQFWHEQILDLGNLIQLLVIILVFGLAKLFGPHLGSFLKKITAASRQVPTFARLWLAADSIIIPLSWLLFQWIGISFASYFGWPHALMTVISSLLSAWVFIRLVSHLIRSEMWSGILAITAWTLAALNMLGLLNATMLLLDQAALTIGELRISLLTLIQGGITLTILLWLAMGLAGLVERHLQHARDFSPAARVLMVKLLRVVLIIVAIMIGLNSLGIDLTAFAVFSGALGVGLGFGLQKIFSNLVSGIILLMDKSIKPGDVIAIGQTYGWINHLGARYASVITRDGTEHLIPNEEMITQRVENWSHSHNMIRMRIPIDIAYSDDPRKAMKLCVEGAEMVPRVLLDPGPKCQLRAFGENGINLEIRVWIEDPQNGRADVVTEVLLHIWDRFQEHGISIPFPQRDVHLHMVEQQESTQVKNEM